MNRRPLTANQLRAARMLARGINQRQVSEELGIRAETVCRWLPEAAFAAELARLADAAERADARTRTEALIHPALDVIARALAEGTPELRVHAAAAVLGFAAALDDAEREPK